MNRDRIMAVLRRIVNGFRAFTLGQKIVLVATILALVVGGILYSKWSSTPSYAPLFTNLAAKDASAIVDKLSASSTPYQLADGGQTIMVPQNDVYSLRLQMSAAGLPAQADTGYSLLDTEGLTTTEFMQQVDYQRALEGELEKTIDSINGVTSASVHLAIPQQDVFSDSTNKTTASVLVGTSPGTELAGSQVEAIVHLVASSVEGLDPNQVTVVGADGTVLSTAGQTTAGGGRDEETTAFEQRMSDAVQQMLDQVVGPNHAIVHVTADLNYDQTNTQSQTYSTTANVPPLSSSTTNETYTGTGAGAGGVLGTTNGTITGTGGNGTYSQQNIVSDNAVNSVVETRQSAPGNISRLGVAVILDQASAAKLNLATVKQIASAAVGLDPARGDTLAVAAMPFDQTATQQNKQQLAASAAATQRTNLMSLVKNGALGLVVVVVLLITWLGSRRRRNRNAAASEAELRKLDALKAQLERTRTASIDDADRPALDSGEATQLMAIAGPLEPAAPTVAEARKKEIEALVDRQPEEVAQLLRSWLATKGS